MKPQRIKPAKLIMDNIEIMRRMNRKKKKRVGRGPGSGHGKTSCRGHKGQKSRSGFELKPSFEGGQMPLIRRIPKRGFVNKFKIDYQIVNIGQLKDNFEKGALINSEVLRETGLISKNSLPVKILGDGELDKALNVKAHKFSKRAKELIEKSGGKIEIVAQNKTKGIQ